MPTPDNTRGRPGVTGLDLAVFLLELALLAALAVAGSRLASPPWARIALGAALPLACAALWGLWLAPRSGRRLPYPARMWAKVALAVVASSLLAVAGLPWWALAFLVVAGGVFAAAEIAGRRRADA